MAKRYPKWLHLSDPHLPYTNMDYWRQAYEFNKTFKADFVDSSGDFFDQYALSRFPKKVKSDNDHMEILKCIPRVRKIAEWFPNMRIMRGNHDARANKRAQDAGFSDLRLTDPLKIVGAPDGWSWYKNDWEPVGPGLLCHGFLSNRQKHAEWFNQNVIHGHLHAKLGIEFFQRNGRAIWVMCIGAMADRHAGPLQYGPIGRFSTMTPGFGTTDEFGRPHVYHLKG